MEIRTDVRPSMLSLWKTVDRHMERLHVINTGGQFRGCELTDDGICMLPSVGVHGHSLPLCAQHKCAAAGLCAQHKCTAAGLTHGSIELVGDAAFDGHLEGIQTWQPERCCEADPGMMERPWLLVSQTTRVYAIPAVEFQYRGCCSLGLWFQCVVLVWLTRTARHPMRFVAWPGAAPGHQHELHLHLHLQCAAGAPLHVQKDLQRHALGF